MTFHRFLRWQPNLRGPKQHTHTCTPELDIIGGDCSVHNYLANAQARETDVKLHAITTTNDERGSAVGIVHDSELLKL